MKPSNSAFTTIERTVYVVALVLAVLPRFINLGSAPLTENEAYWALQALAVSRGPNTFVGEALNSGIFAIGPNPAYVFLTGALFALFGNSDILARFWPALCGSLVVLAPLFFRRQLGRTAAIILAFGLAIDPALVVVSRLAGGPIMAVCFGILALGLWNIGRARTSGMITGLALLSGISIIPGALGLGLVGWFVRIFRLKNAHLQPVSDEAFESGQQDDWTKSAPFDRSGFLHLVIAAAVTIVIVGSGFFLYPQGLTAWASQFTSYFAGWFQPSGIPAARLVGALLVFEFFALVFTVAAIFRYTSDLLTGKPHTNHLLMPFALWAIIAFLLAVIYPARQVSDLIWTVIPLWALASLELQHFAPPRKVPAIVFIHVFAIVTLAGLFWLTLTAINRITVEPPSFSSPILTTAILIGILIMAGLVTALVSMGWSWEIGQLGLVWGMCTVFLIMSISAFWGASQLRPNQPQELWGTLPGPGQARLLMKTVEDISQWNTGMPNYADIYVLNESPALRWELRNFPNARFVTSLPAEELPTMLITTLAEDNPALATAYRGQDFTWWVTPGWTGALPSDLLNWLTFRQAPLLKENLILWVRADRFPSSTPASDNP